MYPLILTEGLASPISIAHCIIVVCAVLSVGFALSKVKSSTCHFVVNTLVRF